MVFSLPNGTCAGVQASSATWRVAETWAEVVLASEERRTFLLNEIIDRNCHKSRRRPDPAPPVHGSLLRHHSEFSTQ